MIKSLGVGHEKTVIGRKNVFRGLGDSLLVLSRPRFHHVRARLCSARSGGVSSRMATELPTQHNYQLSRFRKLVVIYSTNTMPSLLTFCSYIFLEEQLYSQIILLCDKKTNIRIGLH